MAEVGLGIRHGIPWRAEGVVPSVWLKLPGDREGRRSRARPPWKDSRAAD